MTTEVPGYVTKTDLVAALAEGDAGTASARTYQHIMGADPVKEESG
jgi:hypothetical protein